MALEKHAVLARENLAPLHAGFVVLAASWMLGGIGQTFEWIVAALATPSFGLLFFEARERLRSGDQTGYHRLLRWLTPLVLIGVFVIISALNPSHRPAFLYNTYVLRPVPHMEWLPSSARPVESLRLFACLGGLATTGLSLAFCARSRRTLRILLLVIALNTLALAVLGTLQHQTAAAGPYFGLVTSPNTFWFSTFLYHNHWGAFATLSSALAMGLTFYALRNPPERGWWHGPGPLLGLVTLLIAATTPLSGSRSATILTGILLGAAACVASLRLICGKHRNPRGLVLVLLAGLLFAGLIFQQSRAMITVRAQNTIEQLAALRAGNEGYQRLQLYTDTWNMAADKPVFGWGLESYGPIFLRYSTFRPGIDGLMNTFEDAHSDWLQSLAEIGFSGTALLLLLALLPLFETWRRLRPKIGPPETWLLAGCVLVALYACIEFPFANPAVVALWWVSWFAALRLIQLESSTGTKPPRTVS